MGRERDLNVKLVTQDRKKMSDIITEVYKKLCVLKKNNSQGHLEGSSGHTALCGCTESGTVQKGRRHHREV